jgi:hypothetical protein
MNPWLTHAKKVYATMKKKNPNVSYSDALKEAKKTYKKKDVTPKNKDGMKGKKGKK